MEATNLCYGCWDRLTLDSFNLGFINLNSLSRYNITKEKKIED